MAELTMGQVARRAGLATSALRYYESIGLLPEPRRVSGQRRYDPAVLERLAVINLARDVDFSLDEIKVLLDGFPDGTPPAERWRDLVVDKLEAIDARIARARAIKALLQAGLDCQCPDFAACVEFADAQREDGAAE